MTVQTWGDTVVDSLQNLWDRFIGFLPALIGALLVLVIGWYLALGLARLVERLFKVLMVDRGLERLGLPQHLEKVGIKLNVAKVLAFLVKWFLFLVFILAASDVLELTQVSDFLNRVLAYLPNVVIAAVIVLLGVLFSNFARAVIFKSVSAARLASAGLVASIAKWSIFIFALLAALVQLQIAPTLLQILFTGLVAMLAIAGGLAFGLGGRDAARDTLDKIRRDLGNHSS